MSFNELENKAKELAKEILEGKKILLSFPRGTEKTTFGKILAEELLKQTKERTKHEGN